MVLTPANLQSQLQTALTGNMVWEYFRKGTILQYSHGLSRVIDIKVLKK